MASVKRIRLAIHGSVQGVGFRPFIYRLANELGMTGWVRNANFGVIAEVEGEVAGLTLFQNRMLREKPELALIQSVDSTDLAVLKGSIFEIRASTGEGKKTATVLPDIATCPECLKDIADPSNRRYQYPFTNCTNCGPRYSIIDSLPFDRANTSMNQFTMCQRCETEYNDPADRRFHAQPNACPDCGPQVAVVNNQGNTVAEKGAAVDYAKKALLEGKIVAVKGLGGFHLMVDARNREAVIRLRQKKRRSEKPFAVMVSSLAMAREYCDVSPSEEKVLASPAAPIVILRRKKHGSESSWITEQVAPLQPTLGILLPYTPLHHILLNLACFPVVTTSGNLSGEPICVNEREAVTKLGQLADLFLVHNRPILHRVEDSVLMMVMDREMMIRRSRGYAPLPIGTRGNQEGILAVGAHQKNTFAFQMGSNAVISQHMGDLETVESVDSFRSEIETLTRLFDVAPHTLITDYHPEYFSTQYAETVGRPIRRVQHHHAHVLACMADNQLSAPVLGVVWDGNGLGTDHVIWGGEFLQVNDGDFNRVMTFRSFQVPGGDQVAKEPRRSAVGILIEVFAHDLARVNTYASQLSFTQLELTNLIQMVKNGFNSYKTTSVGRLFDAIAALVGLNNQISYQGQAAIALENVIGEDESDERYPFGLSTFVDWEPIVLAVLNDLESGVPVSRISLRFHNSLVDVIVSTAKQIGEQIVVLSGGCFQNRYLLEHAIVALREAGFSPFWHQWIPPNDGGISIGQLQAVTQSR